MAFTPRTAQNMPDGLESADNGFAASFDSHRIQ